MKQESARFSQQAINRIAEIAIASQLKQDVEIKVDIVTTLSQLAKGQIDAIAILIHRLVLSGDLKTEMFQLDLGAVTVKPLSAMKGRIKLVHPSQGKVTVLIHENDLTAALNQSLNRSLNFKPEHQPKHQPGNQLKRSDLSEEEINFPGNLLQSNQAISSLQCVLDNGMMIVRFYPASRSSASSTASSTAPLTDTELIAESIVLTAVPLLPQNEGQEMIWQPLLASDPFNPVSSANQSSAGWLTEVLNRLQQILSLKDFEQKGLFLSIQNVQIADGKLRIDADALIQEFPPD